MRRNIEIFYKWNKTPPHFERRHVGIAMSSHIWLELLWINKAMTHEEDTCRDMPTARSWLRWIWKTKRDKWASSRGSGPILTHPEPGAAMKWVEVAWVISPGWVQVQTGSGLDPTLFLCVCVCVGLAFASYKLKNQLQRVWGALSPLSIMTGVQSLWGWAMKSEGVNSVKLLLRVSGWIQAEGRLSHALHFRDTPLTPLPTPQKAPGFSSPGIQGGTQLNFLSLRKVYVGVYTPSFELRLMLSLHPVWVYC